MPYSSVFSHRKFKKSVFLKILQIILIIAVGGVVSVLIFQKIEEENKEFLEKKAKIQEIKSLHKMEIELRSGYAVIKDYLEDIIDFLPTEGEAIKPIAFLEKIAQETNNTQRLLLDEKSEIYQKDFKKTRGNVELSGNFSSFVRHLQELELSPYFFDVNNLQLVGPANLNERGTMKFTTSFIFRNK